MDWNEYLFGFAAHAARKSKDATQVGAVLVAPNGRSVLLTAFNGPPPGVRDLPERRERPTKYLFAAHAERNLIATAARHGIRTEGTSVYCTHRCCAACAGELIAAGVRAFFYGSGRFGGDDEQWVAASAMLNEARVYFGKVAFEEPAAPPAPSGDSTVAKALAFWSAIPGDVVLSFDECARTAEALIAGEDPAAVAARFLEARK